MARFLATAYVQGWLDFPLSVEHRDNTGNPDFLLVSPSFTVGVECVEAVAQSWYEIDVLRERLYPGAMIFLQKFKAGEQTLSREQKHAIASGSYAGPPWMGDEPEREWATAHEHFIADKVRKLRNGNYAPLNRLWLLVQDEWGVPVHETDDKLEAADLLLPKLSPLLAEPSFEKVFISSSPLLLTFDSKGIDAKPLEDLWR